MDWTIRRSNLGGGEISPFLSRPALGPTQPPVQWVPIPFLGIKRPGRSADDPSPSSTVLKERLVLYLYSPSGPWRRVLGSTLPSVYFLPKLNQSGHSVKVMYRPVVNQSDAAWHTLINCHEHTPPGKYLLPGVQLFHGVQFTVSSKQCHGRQHAKLYFRFRSSHSAIPATPNYKVQYLTLKGYS